jgi:hypothetical protein
LARTLLAAFPGSQPIHRRRQQRGRHVHCAARTAPRAPRPVEFNLTQKGQALTGTAGPPEKQWTLEKAAVNAGKATFEVQQPDGPLFKFTLTIVKGRLQGDMAGERDGVVRGHARVDAAKAAKAK